LSKLKDAIDEARFDAQKVHQSISANTARNHATIRADLQNAGERARDLAASLKQVVGAQESDTKQHIKDASAALEETAKSAKTIAGSNEADLKRANEAMLIGATAAVRSLSKAVAAKRSSSNLVNKAG
jgi:hypothetical protein